MGGCPSTLVFGLTGCVEMNVFQECWLFIFQNVSVNFPHQLLHESIMQHAETYGKAQNAKFQANPIAL